MRCSRTAFASLLLSALLLAACKRPAADTTDAAAPPLEIKVVVVTMFEIGADSGDQAGEFQLWRERQALDTRLPFAHHHDLFLNEKTGVLGLVTGMGTANSATAVMALGLDPRFDLSHAYWLVAGIAGFDPADASIGSAAWAEYLVDGDLAHEIDAREMPGDWPTGYFPRGTQGPYGLPKPQPTGEMFALNGALSDWAYQLTRNVDLGDHPVLQQRRAPYAGFPNAQKQPFVLKGDNFAAMTYWHGALLNEWANRWTQYWTDGKGEFVSSAMEDTGTAQSLSYLSPTGKADYNRLMVLRTASNYTMQPPGLSAAQNLLEDHGGAPGEGYAALNMAVEAAYQVGAKVVDELVSHWALYRDRVPGTP